MIRVFRRSWRYKGAINGQTQVAGVTVKQVYGSRDAGLSGGLPNFKPFEDEAIYISSSGTQFNWYNRAWH